MCHDSDVFLIFSVTTGEDSIQGCSKTGEKRKKDYRQKQLEGVDGDLVDGAVSSHELLQRQYCLGGRSMVSRDLTYLLDS